MVVEKNCVFARTSSTIRLCCPVSNCCLRLHDEQNHHAMIVVDGLETKLHELITRLSCEENVKHEEHRNNLRVSLADVLNKMRSEMKQASDEAAARSRCAK